MPRAFDKTVWFPLTRVNQDQPKACAEMCHGIQLIGGDISLIIDALVFHGSLIDRRDGRFGPVQEWLGERCRGIQICRHLAFPFSPLLLGPSEGGRPADATSVHHPRWRLGVLDFLQQLRKLGRLLLQELGHQLTQGGSHLFRGHR